MRCSRLTAAAISLPQGFVDNSGGGAGQIQTANARLLGQAYEGTLAPAACDITADMGWQSIAFAAKQEIVAVEEVG